MWHSSTNAMNYLHLRDHEAKFLYLFRNQSSQIMDFFNVDRATAYRWIQHKKPLTGPALRLLDIAAAGFIPQINGWNGFIIVNNRLITPNGLDLLPGEISHFGEIYHLKATARALCNRSRNNKPWRDREPAFVKRFNKRQSKKR